MPLEPDPDLSRLRLPYRLATALTKELLFDQHCWRRAIESDAARRFDAPLFARFDDALDDALHRIESCRPEAYDGPFADVVRARERGVAPPADALAQLPHYLRDGADDAHLADGIVDALTTARRDVPWLGWLSIARYAPLCQNDACATEFAPLVRADPGAVRWFVAASLHTWAHSGVWTAPYLRASLTEFVRDVPALDATLQRMHEHADPHTRWMARYAVEVLDGRWDARANACEGLLARYTALLAAR